MTGKRLRKNNSTIALQVLYLKKNEYISSLHFQNTIPEKNQKSYETPSIIYTGLESLRKNNSTIALHVLYLKKNEYISSLHFQNTT